MRKNIETCESNFQLLSCLKQRNTVSLNDQQYRLDEERLTYYKTSKHYLKGNRFYCDMLFMVLNTEI